MVIINFCNPAIATDFIAGSYYRIAPTLVDYSD